MVLAIALTGIVCLSAIVPTTQAIATYQAGETHQRQAAAHELAAVRIEQLANSVWRDPNGPAGGARLQFARGTQFEAGGCGVRLAGTRLETLSNGTWAQLAPAAGTLVFEYLGPDGLWTSTPSSLGNVVALRASWVDTAGSRPRFVTIVFPDCAFTAGRLKVQPPSAGGAYDRASYQRALNLPLGSWR
jgi:hypothetical protein